MEKLLQMLGILAALYIAYVLSLKKWDYASESKRAARRTWLKSKGLSNTFYFIHAGTLFLLNMISGGLFVFYWIYRQWQAVLRGFRRLDGISLEHGPFIRTLGGFGTFFSLNAIICRTCEYMRKKSPMPPWVWGTLWLTGLAGTLLLPMGAEKGFCYFFFCAAPAALQHRLNALPTMPLITKPKPTELIATVIGLIIALAIVMIIRIFF